MNLPRLTTVGGAYQYLMGMLVLLAVIFAVLFGAMLLGYVSF